MTKREKVIRGLELCAYDPDPGQELKEIRSCPECPYYRAGCSPQLIRDALALLNEQEPRVMTLEEVIKLNDWIWVDYKDGFNGYEYKLDYDSDCDRVEWLDGATDGMEEYGKTWRCWTSRPTPEQMRETKWEDEDAE